MQGPMATPQDEDLGRMMASLPSMNFAIVFLESSYIVAGLVGWRYVRGYLVMLK